jgi:hypothetical protein
MEPVITPGTIPTGVPMSALAGEAPLNIATPDSRILQPTLKGLQQVAAGQSVVRFTAPSLVELRDILNRLATQMSGPGIPFGTPERSTDADQGHASTSQVDPFPNAPLGGPTGGGGAECGDGPTQPRPQ